jgi:NAD(P)-dependent dehydrogenase (short-subunit alcohol dehydrogenase family)/rhamnose utilization protein RhaD (predicted bifunctional aldolase and dehydrogenase)
VIPDIAQISNDPEFGPVDVSYKSRDGLFILTAGSKSIKRVARRDLQLPQKEPSAKGKPPKDAPAESEIAIAEQRRQKPPVDHELLLHELFPQPYVMFSRSPLLRGFASGREGEAAASKLFSGRTIWLPLIGPRTSSIRKLSEGISLYEEKRGGLPDGVFLQSRGLVLGAPSLEQLKEQAGSFIQAIKGQTREVPDSSPIPTDLERAMLLAPAVRMLLQEETGSSIVVFKTNRQIQNFLKNARSFQELSAAFGPGRSSLARRVPVLVPRREGLENQHRALAKAIEAYRRRQAETPLIVAVQGLGVFAWGASKGEADRALLFFEDTVGVVVYARNFGGALPLSNRQIEDYAASIQRDARRGRERETKGAAPRLAEKVAIVTGAARGFGKGIAEAIASEGACVVLADINEEPIQKNADRLCRLYGQGKAIAVVADVGEDEGILNMIRKTILTYGGLDLYVSNAGIVEAGGLDTIELSTFEAMTRVNYTGYFLGVKQASRIMKIQHRFDDIRYMDIVQINSKSGLEGSDRNFAYAGGKFGGIGLTQSFAKELIPYHIKVNAICPGNYFDGPLWTDPENGVFQQYLKAGKVPGAKTIEDVRRVYEEKIPMGRGCRIVDVVRALLYLVEQSYETGQALPVTGGQIMLS